MSRILDAYRSSNAPWYLGFSGGKDSSAVLKLVYSALLRSRARHKLVTVVYCDTGVEVPLIAGRVRSTLRRLSIEAREDRIPIQVRIARPRTHSTFFVKVIGRGYPPPTNKFRWCTDRLRIHPVREILEAGEAEESVVVLGTRMGESPTRDLTLRRHETANRYFYRQGEDSSVSIFAPIADYTTRDVWKALAESPRPAAVDQADLVRLYSEAGAECPIVRDPEGTPCSAGRFGCWTCTVVRQDKSTRSMISNGYNELKPLLEFRDWLASVRSDPSFRCKRRRNGSKGPGPFTLDARRQILRRLRSTEARVPWRLITKREVKEIHRLWRLDRESREYRET